MIISQTPLRVSLAGGGTDLPDYCALCDGKVLSTAIDKYVYIIIQERFDDQIHVNYARRKEVVMRVKDVKHDLAREAMLIARLDKGFEVTTLADIPSEGTGLGSSSSLTVGFLNAFHAYAGRQVDAGTLARQACEIEIDRLGKPIGRQDQYIAAYGGVKFFTFFGDGSVGVEEAGASQDSLRRLEEGLLLYFTDKTRRADKLLRAQRRRTRDNRCALDRIRDLAVESRDALAAGAVDAIGRNLDANWRLKKGLAKGISRKDIDRLYARARRSGALGGKLTGAGGGGFMLLYAPRSRREKLRGAMRGRRELPIALEPDGSKIVFNVKRRVWK